MNELSLALGLIVHPADRDLLPALLKRHAPFFDEVCLVLDADPDEPGPEALAARREVSEFFSPCPERLRLLLRPLAGDFAAQRNACAALNPCDWLLMLDADERFDLRTLKLLRPVLGQLAGAHPEARVFGLARDNVVDGRATKIWPDWQYRLVRRGVKWHNTDPHPGASPGCHEMPRELHENPDTVKVLGHLVIRHEKSSARQRAQQQRYGAMG